MFLVDKIDTKKQEIYKIESKINKLKELKAMQESGLISEEEYNNYKKAILQQFISK